MTIHTAHASRPLSVYIHVPFCVQKCHYCDFCSFPKMTEDVKRRYVREICRRIEAVRDTVAYGEYRVQTVYFGGGTPTLLDPHDFSEMLLAIRSVFPIEWGAEITAECNPGTVDGAYLSALYDAGVNRLSIGLQSSNREELRQLGRIHTAEDFFRCVKDARAAGFSNLSADVMFGIPEQTCESFRETLRAVCDAGVDHVSAYGLKIEEGTVFGRHPERLRLPDEDAEEEMYRDACEILLQHGLSRYEISNFARTGYYSQHNYAYWTLQEYLGFGVAAHSYFRGARIGNSRDLYAFLRGEDITESREEISRAESIAEYVMLGMRLACGVRDTEFDAFFGEAGLFDRLYREKMKPYMDLGLICTESDGIRTNYAFTTEGFRVSNYILSEILPAQT
jgi:oxygen-independent coproporphyrinogen-3 oxidase